MLSEHIIQQKRPSEQGSFFAYKRLLALRLLKGRVYATEATVLRERQFLFVRLLVLAGMVTDAAARTAFHLYQVFRKLRFSHISPPSIR